jgi:hypothetical protein
MSGGLARVAELTVGHLDTVEGQDIDDPGVGAPELRPCGVDTSIELDELITTNDLDVDLKEL